MKKFKKKDEDIPGIAFVGCLFIGLGLGMFYGNVAIGALIGLGAGFIVMALLKYLLRKK
jgi:hypothetical protein